MSFTLDYNGLKPGLWRMVKDDQDNFQTVSLLFNIENNRSAGFYLQAHKDIPLIAVEAGVFTNNNKYESVKSTYQTKSWMQLIKGLHETSEWFADSIVSKALNKKDLEKESWTDESPNFQFKEGQHAMKRDFKLVVTFLPESITTKEETVKVCKKC